MKLQTKSQTYICPFHLWLRVLKVKHFMILNLLRLLSLKNILQNRVHTYQTTLAHLKLHHTSLKILKILTLLF